MDFITIVAIETQLLLNLNRKLNAKRAQKIMAERAEEEQKAAEKAERDFVTNIMLKCARVSAKQIKENNKSLEKEISELKKDREVLKSQIEDLMKKVNAEK